MGGRSSRGQEGQRGQLTLSGSGRVEEAASLYCGLGGVERRARCCCWAAPAGGQAAVAGRTGGGGGGPGGRRGAGRGGAR